MYTAQRLQHSPVRHYVSTLGTRTSAVITGHLLSAIAMAVRPGRAVREYRKWRWAWGDLFVAMSDVHAVVCLAAMRLLFILVSYKRQEVNASEPNLRGFSGSREGVVRGGQVGGNVAERKLVRHLDAQLVVMPGT